MDRNLDGYYFRVKRDGKWQSICFSDMTPEERDEIGKDRSKKWWRSLAIGLLETLEELDSQCDIFSPSERGMVDELSATTKDTDGTESSYQQLAYDMADLIKHIGDTFDIEVKYEE